MLALARVGANLSACRLVGLLESRKVGKLESWRGGAGERRAGRLAALGLPAG